MFCLSESDTFYLYPYPTDMRKSFYSLSGIVTNEMKRDVQDGVMPKSPIGKALGYLLGHIRQLSRYITDGRYQIDNNFIENSVRPLALGRKNYLFCGNHDAAEDAAIIYTFMGCCKLAQVDVRKWLNYFFTHIHDYDEDYSRDLLELLPHNLKQKGIL